MRIRKRSNTVLSILTSFALWHVSNGGTLPHWCLVQLSSSTGQGCKEQQGFQAGAGWCIMLEWFALLLPFVLGPTGTYGHVPGCCDLFGPRQLLCNSGFGSCPQAQVTYDGPKQYLSNCLLKTCSVLLPALCPSHATKQVLCLCPCMTRQLQRECLTLDWPSRCQLVSETSVHLAQVFQP